MKKVFFIIILTAAVQSFHADEILVRNNAPESIGCARNQCCTCNPCMCGSSCCCGTYRNNTESQVHKIFSRISKCCRSENFESILQSTLCPGVKNFVEQILAQIALDDQEKQWLLAITKDFNNVMNDACIANEFEEKYLQLLAEKESELAAECDGDMMPTASIKIRQNAQKFVDDMLSSDNDYKTFCAFKTKLKDFEEKMMSIERCVDQLSDEQKNQMINWYCALVKTISQTMIDSIGKA